MNDPIESEFPEYPIWRDVAKWQEVKERLANTSAVHVKIPETVLPHPSESPEFAPSTLSFSSGTNTVRHSLKHDRPPTHEIFREKKKGWHLHVRVQNGYYRAELDHGNPDQGEYVTHAIDLLLRAH